MSRLHPTVVEAMHRDLGPLAAEIAALADRHGVAPSTIAKHVQLVPVAPAPVKAVRAKRHAIAAPSYFPYLSHRTLAEVREDEVRQSILNSLGRA